MNDDYDDFNSYMDIWKEQFRVEADFETGAAEGAERLTKLLSVADMLSLSIHELVRRFIEDDALTSFPSKLHAVSEVGTRVVIKSDGKEVSVEAELANGSKYMMQYVP